MRSALPLSLLCLLRSYAIGGSVGHHHHHYTANDDATWAVVSSNLSDATKQIEYDFFMEACRASAGDEAHHLCDKDEAYRLQMNMYQPRSVRTKMFFRAPKVVLGRASLRESDGSASNLIFIS